MVICQSIAVVTGSLLVVIIHTSFFFKGICTMSSVNKMLVEGGESISGEQVVGFGAERPVDRVNGIFTQRQ
jgi:hypothetical protein